VVATATVSVQGAVDQAHNLLAAAVNDLFDEDNSPPVMTPSEMSAIQRDPYAGELLAGRRHVAMARISSLPSKRRYASHPPLHPGPLITPPPIPLVTILELHCRM
jgi:hypothetical protein